RSSFTFCYPSSANDCLHCARLHSALACTPLEVEMRVVVVFSVALLGCTAGNPGRNQTTGGSASNGGNGGNGGTTGNGGCTGLACNQVSCPGGGTTTVTGRVTAPNGLDPVYDAAVYVPAMIPEFPQTVQCEVCNEPLGGMPIVSTSTDVNGNF